MSDTHTKDAVSAAEDERRRARLSVCALAKDAHDAKLLLDTLGLLGDS